MKKKLNKNSFGGVYLCGNIFSSRYISVLKNVGNSFRIQLIAVLIFTIFFTNLVLFYRKTFVNVAIQLADAHEKGSDASCITFAYDNHHIATRGGDDTLKLWDIRYFKKPVKVASNLFSR